jgi:hypothetical protein
MIKANHRRQVAATLFATVDAAHDHLITHGPVAFPLDATGPVHRK